GSVGVGWTKPVPRASHLPAADRGAAIRTTGPLPSRAAANLFWLARYVERAEATLRLVRALVNRATEIGEAAANLNIQACALLDAWNAVPTDLPIARPNLVAAAALPRRDPEARLPD